jgi:hypothetical protein
MAKAAASLTSFQARISLLYSQAIPFCWKTNLPTMDIHHDRPLGQFYPNAVP